MATDNVGSLTTSTSGWQHRPALVTGANGLLTSAVAGQLAAAGVPLLLHLRRNAGRVDSDPVLRDAPRLRCDTATDDGRDALVAAAIDRAPLGSIILGASQFTRTPVLELDREAIRSVIRLELESHLELVCRLAPHIVDGGRVLLFSDAAIGLGWPDYTVYLAAKGGLAAAVLALARALGPRLIVSAIAPGSLVGTPPPPDGDPCRRTPLMRQGTPAEVAAAAIGLMFLPAPVAQATVLIVDGGRRLNYPEL